MKLLHKYFAKSRGLLILYLVLLTGSPGKILAYQQGDDLSLLFEKMRNARRSIGFIAEVKVEREFRGRSRVHKKKVTVQPPRVYKEELILSDEQKKRIDEYRERMNREGRKRRPEDSRHWNNRFQHDRGPENQFNMHGVKLDLLTRNYDVANKPAEPVAGRETTLLSIIPKYDNRPTNLLWIDKDTGIILKRELKESGNGSGALYRETFTSLELLPVDEKAVEEMRKLRESHVRRRSGTGRSRNVTTTEYNSLDEVPENYRNKMVIPSTIPGGFTLDNIRIYSENDNISFNQVYTDGLLLFSLAQFDGKPVDMSGRQNTSARGRGRNSGRTVLTKRDGRTNFILVGFARRQLLRQVLDGLPGKEAQNNRNRR